MAALRACGGMVDFTMTDGKSPVLFTTDGYQLVVMPMLTAESKPKAEAEPEEAEKAEAVAAFLCLFVGVSLPCCGWGYPFFVCVRGKCRRPMAVQGTMAGILPTIAYFWKSIWTVA